MSEDTDYRRYWELGVPWREYLESHVRSHVDVWRKIDARTRLPEWALERARRLPGEWRLLVLSEDWCMDGPNSMPVLARVAEAAPAVEMRVVGRDANPELMDCCRTDGSRSIPLALILRPDFTRAGRWGPRPAVLQEQVLREKRAGARSTTEILRDARRWYVLDRGESTARELLETLEAAGAGRPASAPPRL